MTPLPVVITGAHGFVGHALCLHFSAIGRPFRAVVREASTPRPWQVPPIVLGDLAHVSEEALDAAMASAFAVVHLAGRAHVMHDRVSDPRAQYRNANAVATERVVQAARRSGLKRFILASTVKVCAERTAPGRPLTPDSPAAPEGYYARSKAEAERAVLETCAGTPLAPLVLRLPLTYGPRVRGNFVTLIDVVARERWLPLGAVRNLRSVLYVGNLVEAIDAALSTREAVTGVHYLCDATPVSTTRLIEAIAHALEIKARLVDVPVPLLRAAGTLVGKGERVARLVESLEVDSSSFREASGWKPRFTLEEGLAATMAWWRVRHAI